MEPVVNFVKRMGNSLRRRGEGEANAGPGNTGGTNITIDFTSKDNSKENNLELLKNGNVTEIKINIKDLELLTTNLSCIKTSLLQLKVRSGIFLEDDEPEGDVTPQSFEILSSSEQFIEALGEFQNLQSLYFENDGSSVNGITKSAYRLQNLKTLVLQNCGKLSIDQKDLNSIWPNIQYLELHHNQLSMFPKAVCSIKCLKILDLSHNHIASLPREIEGLENLEKLVLSYNKLTELPKDILKLKSLRKLYLAFNSLEMLPSNIGEMINLTHLELSGNKLTCLPKSIGNLKDLMKLNLCSNRITALPEEISMLNVHDDALLLANNPFQLPPIEVCANGKRAIQVYFEAIHNSERKSCRRLKAVLLGESFAGKTSLVHALVNGYDGNIQPDDRTVGLDYHNLRLKPLDDTIEVLLFDCAGQRQYLLTHQFFFAEGALFILCMDLSKYKSDADHNTMVGDWVNLVISQVPGATILIVPTHVDICKQQEVDYKARCETLLKKLCQEEKERIGLLEKEIQYCKFNPNGQAKLQELSYLKKTRPKISMSLSFTMEEYENKRFGDGEMALIPVCCRKDLEGLIILKKEIERIAENKILCPVVSREVPTSWVTLEEKIVSFKAEAIPFMPVETLFNRCTESCSLTSEVFDLALRYFDDIGLISYFPKVQQAKHLVFLDLQWLVSFLHLLFRVDHQSKLNYTDDMLRQVQVWKEEFDNDKSLFLEKGLLSSSLLKCIWLPLLKNVEDETLFSQAIGVFQHFGIICRLERDGIYQYFIPWFADEAEPDTAKVKWEKHKDDWEIDVVTRVSIGIGRLPTSVLDRLLVSAQNRTEICIPWKSGFLVIFKSCMFRCQVNNGALNSSVIFHGRSEDYEGCYEDVWKFILFMIKELCLLIKEWNGMVFYDWYSLCPQCVRRNRSKPFIFKGYCDDESRACHKCNEFILTIQVQPPAEKGPTGGPSTDTQLKTDPLTDLEISDVASMLGTRHTRLASLIGLSQQEIEIVQADFRGSYEQSVQLLQKWKRAKGQANRSDLIKAVKKMKNCDQLILYLQTGRK